MRTVLLLGLALTLTLGAAGAVPWRHPLSYDGGGYWNTRVGVEITNAGDKAAEGALVRIPLRAADATAALIGAPVASLRVMTAEGAELIFDLVDSEGRAKRSGTLAEGDAIVVPLEAAPHAPATVYLYAGNARAWLPPEWLQAGLRNAGFEEGNETPTGWQAGSVDADHRMSLERGAAYQGDSAARCDVTPGAAPTWVQYRQGDIPVTPGARYRFTGWVKARDIEGTAGWYVHINGVEPQMVNQVRGWDGAFDWREVSIEFEAPEGGQSFCCGTVLHGSGTAWYDDASLERIDEEAGGEVRVLPVEQLELKRVGNEAPWCEDGEGNPASAASPWAWRVPIVLRNFTDAAAGRSLATIDTRRIRNYMAKLLGFAITPGVRLVDPDSPGGALPFAGEFGGDIYATSAIPAHAEKTLWLYLAAGSGTPGQSQNPTMTAWAGASVNLLRNGNMEQGDEDTPEAWDAGVEGPPGQERFHARRVRGGLEGAWCLELTVPDAIDQPGWTGWRQRVPVKPAARYLLAGHLKTSGCDVGVSLHGHFQRADGSLTAQPFFSTATDLKGATEWTAASIVVATPADCAFLEVHLTMNGHGTLWHDAVLLAEVTEGVPGEVEPHAPIPAEAEAWVVNPLVKVFREDTCPLEAVRAVDIAASRNTYEPFQIVLRAPEDTRAVIACAALSGPEGAALEAPALYRVGYVPIDFPMGYDNSSAPAWRRLTPHHRGSDGWAGWWPDPLEPLPDGALPLAARETQPLWFEVHVPASAAPGEYRGVVMLDVVHSTSPACVTPCGGFASVPSQSPGLRPGLLAPHLVRENVDLDAVVSGNQETGRTHIEIPLRLTVWNQVAPDEKALPALYDLRSGPGWDIFSGKDRADMVRRWYSFLARYNVSPSMVEPYPSFSHADGAVAMDCAEFDAAAAYLLDELHVNKVYTPWLFYACGWAYQPQDLFGLKAFTPEYVAAWQSAYRLFIDHTTDRGWRDKFVFYLSDEPHESSRATIEALGRVADMAREVAPDVPVYSSTWHYIDGLAGHVTLWGAGPQGSFDEDNIEERRAAGDHFWFTTDGQMCTDTPLLAIERLLPWFCFRCGVDAYEFWGVSWWTYDPWERGWHTYIRQSDQGRDWYHVRYPNGDGFLTYPAKTGQGGEPLPSIRLAAARDGVDDYEVFLALRRRAELGNARVREVLDDVRRLVEMPNRGGRFSSLLMPDPDAVQAARRAAGNLLSQLETTAPPTQEPRGR